MDRQLSKLEDLLPDYDHGAETVMQLGQEISVRTNRPDVPHP